MSWVLNGPKSAIALKKVDGETTIQANSPIWAAPSARSSAQNVRSSKRWVNGPRQTALY